MNLCAMAVSTEVKNCWFWANFEVTELLEVSDVKAESDSWSEIFPEAGSSLFGVE